MEKLTQDKLKEIYKDNKNLIDKPIYIDFYADW
jgi:thiol:disulfide interchange protein